MAAETGIEWADATFSPWRGCQTAGPECDHCYAETTSKRNPAVLGKWGSVGSGGTRVVAAESYWRQPLLWNADAARHTIHDYASPGGRVMKRRRVFCASISDVFEDWKGPMRDSQSRPMFFCMCGLWLSAPCEKCEESWPLTMNDVRKRLFWVIDRTPNLDWMLLTKRPQNIKRLMPEINPSGNLDPIASTPYGHPMRKFRSNVWLGTTAGTQAMAEKRVDELVKCRKLAPVLFVSAEPLLEQVDFSPWLSSIDWLIVGGESGAQARPMDPAWVRSARDQAVAAGVPFHFKQWGEFIDPHPSELHLSTARLVDFNGLKLQRIGKKAAGRLLDGCEWNEFPSTDVV